ncbi:MAG: hypothetical protein EPO32_00925 [Anaerolineae bacterium]|nr:MAG: hypothetical protein EPO32_00925 [Anaerolineae bacterium]
MTEHQTGNETDALAGLESPSAEERQAAISALLEISPLPAEGVATLERMALHDRSKSVQAGARDALSSPAVRAWRKAQPGFSRQLRDWLLNQIATWRADELLTAEQAEVLTRRYDFDAGAAVPAQPSAAAAPKPRKEPKPRRSLGEVLMSESTIKTALYLGAFFVIMAAFIFSALIEILRIPILAGTSLLFLVGSLALKRRLGQASFVLFILYSALVPLAAGAVFEALPFLSAFSYPFWIGVTTFLLANWVFATWFYHSRFFSLLALGAFFVLPFQVGNWFNLEDVLVLNLAALGNLLVLGVVVLWRRVEKLPSSRPVWIVTHLWQVVLLAAGFFMAITYLLEDERWLWAEVSLWGLAALFYLLAGLAFKSSLAVYAGVFVSLLMPWYAAGALLLKYAPLLTVLAAWSLGCLVLAEVLRRMKVEFLRTLAAAVDLGGGLMLAFALLASTLTKPLDVLLLQAISLFVLFVLMLVRSRALVWIGALFAAFLVYRTLMLGVGLPTAALPPGHVMLVAAAAYLALDVIVRRARAGHPAWQVSPTVFGGLSALFAALLLLNEVESGTLWAVAGYAGLAVVLLLYSVLVRFRWGVPLVAAALALGWASLLVYLEPERWVLISFVLPVIFLAAWFVLARRGSGWARPTLVGGLGLAALLTLLSPLEGEALSGLVGAAGALLLAYGVEGLAARHSPEVALPRNVLWGALAAALGWLLLMSLISGADEPFAALGGLLLLAALNLHLVFRYRWPDGLLGVCAAFAGALHYALDGLGMDEKTLPMVILAGMFLGIGLLPRLNGERLWGAYLRASGLVLAALAGLVSLGLESWSAVFTLALAALLYTAEAFRRRSVSLALPADLLYLAAYFKVLLAFQVEEPQFYSVGAAALGMLMHYLLIRTGSGALAFIAGMLSQLILLGTTYIQMVDTGRFVFFFILFFQALVVTVYGLLVRSRSLVITPIVIVVIGVITVVFSSLQGLAALVMLGCTGFLLLGLAILALVLRERLAKAGQLMRERMEDWSA